MAHSGLVQVGGTIGQGKRSGGTGLSRKSRGETWRMGRLQACSVPGVEVGV